MGCNRRGSIRPEFRMGKCRSGHPRSPRIQPPHGCAGSPGAACAVAPADAAVQRDDLVARQPTGGSHGLQIEAKFTPVANRHRHPATRRDPDPPGRDRAALDPATNALQRRIPAADRGAGRIIEHGDTAIGLRALDKPGQWLCDQRGDQRPRRRHGRLIRGSTQGHEHRRVADGGQLHGPADTAGGVAASGVGTCFRTRICTR